MKKQTITFTVITLALGCFAFLPQVQAVSPATDGCYPNFTTAEGCDALSFLTTGAGNTALGWRSLFLDSAGSFNTAVGGGALALNNADSNTAVGAAALLLNTSGTQNTAVGTNALVFNDSGSFNTANGFNALYFNITGIQNTANGYQALYNNTTGFGNTANGLSALSHNTTGGLNTANGYQALWSNTEGAANAALGDAAGFFITTGDNNTCLGAVTCGNTTSADNVVCIGFGAAGENISDRAYIPNIGQFAQTPIGGSVEFVTVRLSDGKLGHDVSARRYKEDIKPMGNASELIYKLKPVTYRFKETDVDPKKGAPPQNLDYGLIAEEVAEIEPRLAIRDGKGQIESLRYKAIYNMLLNEFLKEHGKVEKLEATVAQQQKNFESRLAQHQEQIESLTSDLQKVSSRIEATRPAPQVAVNNP